MLGRRTFNRLVAAGALSAAPFARARADAAAIRIGVLTDLSSTNAAASGPGSISAAQMALEDFRQMRPDVAVELVSADLQNKPDIASGIARRWFDQEAVDMIVDMPQSAVALAIAHLARDKNKVTMISGAATSDLTAGANCSPNHVHWSADTYSYSKTVADSILRSGGDTWFFIEADYAFGAALVRDCAHIVEQSGGKVVGRLRYPFPDTTDFSSFLLQAQASGAKALGLAMTGDDVVNCLKQAHEFGIRQGGQRIGGMSMLSTTIHAVGPELAEGIVTGLSFYTDRDDGTRAFSRRFAGRNGGAMPNQVHAGTYAATLHYLKAAAQVGVDRAKADGRGVVKAMKAMPTEDAAFGKASIREDGRFMCDMLVLRAKGRAESKGEWDLFDVVATVPPEDAFRSLRDGACQRT